MKKVNTKQATNKLNKIVGYTIIAIIVVGDRGVASKGYQQFLGDMSTDVKNGLGILAAVLAIGIVFYIANTLRK